MLKNKNKEKLIREFALMKGFEKWAGDFYLKIADNPKIERETREVFREIAEDEYHHAKIVQRVLNIINNNLWKVE